MNGADLIQFYLNYIQPTEMNRLFPTREMSMEDVDVRKEARKS